VSAADGQGAPCTAGSDQHRVAPKLAAVTDRCGSVSRPSVEADRGVDLRTALRARRERLGEVAGRSQFGCWDRVEIRRAAGVGVGVEFGAVAKALKADPT
jgi:hypothetical protein